MGHGLSYMLFIVCTEPSRVEPVRWQPLFLYKTVNKMLRCLGIQVGIRASLHRCPNRRFCVQRGVGTGERVDLKYGRAYMKLATERGL